MNTKQILLLTTAISTLKFYSNTEQSRNSYHSFMQLSWISAGFLLQHMDNFSSNHSRKVWEGLFVDLVGGCLGVFNQLRQNHFLLLSHFLQEFQLQWECVCTATTWRITTQGTQKYNCSSRLIHGKINLCWDRDLSSWN